MTDAELLRTYAETRSDAAFAELLRRHLPLVYSAAMRRLAGDAHRAKDVSQLVFLALARNAARLATHAEITAWLYATTRNVAVDVVRSERRREVWQQEAHAMDEIIRDPEPDWAAVRPELDDAMDRLNPREREAVLLRFFGGHPFREIGRSLQISEDAARMRVDRGLERLRALLAAKGIRSSAAALGALLAHEASASPLPAELASSIAARAAESSVSSGLFGKLIIMTTTQKIAAVAAVAGLLVVGAGVREIQAARAASTSAAEARFAADRTNDRAESLSREVEAARQPTTMAASAGRFGITGAMESVQSIERDKFRLYATLEWRERLGWSMPLLERAGASESQIADYAALVSGEMTNEVLDRGGVRTVADVERFLSAQWSEKVRALLGEEKYARLSALSAAERTLTQFSEYMERIELPLEQRQLSRLFEVLAGDASLRTAEGRFDWTQVYSASVPILSPTQLAAWQRWNNLTVFRRNLQEMMQRRAESAAAATEPR